MNNIEATIEPAKPEDAEAIMRIKRAAWLEAYPDEELSITLEEIEMKLPAQIQ